MRFRFHDKLYSDGYSDRQLKNVKNNIIKGKLKTGPFLVTLPVANEGVLEIYRYPEFLQPAYKNIDDEVVVVGIAKSKEDAFSLVERIVKDVGVVDGKLNIMDFFK